MPPPSSPAAASSPSSSSSSSSSSSASSSPSAQNRIAALREAVLTSNSYRDHLALVHALRASADLPATRAARRCFADHHPLHPSVWLQWLNDELSLATTVSHRLELLPVFRRALDDFLSIPLHCLYHQLQCDLLAQHALDRNTVRAAFDHSFQRGAFHHFTDGHQLWQIYHSFLTSAKEPPAFEKPEYQNTPSQLSSHLAQFEQKLTHARTQSDPALLLHAYTSYAAFVQQAYPVALISLYERMIADHSSHHPAWLHYLSYLAHPETNHHHNHHHHHLLSFVANRATRAVPDCIQAWSYAVLSVSQDPTPDQKLDQLLRQVHPFVTTSLHYAAAEALTKNAWSVYLVLRAPANLLPSLNRALLFNVQGSVQWAAASCHAAAVLVAANRHRDAELLFQAVVQARPAECRWRLHFAAAIRATNPPLVRDTFETGMRHATSPTDVAILRDAWQAFELALPDTQSLLRRLHRIDVAAAKFAPHKHYAPDLHPAHGKRTNARRHNVRDPNKRKKTTASHHQVHPPHPPKIANGSASAQQTSQPVTDMDDQHHRATPSQTAEKDVQEEQKQQANTSPTVSVSRQPNPPGDDPEPNTVFISNLPFDVKEEQLRHFFRDAAPIRQIRIPLRSDGATKGIAYVEFGHDAAVQKALTKHLQPIHGRTVSVKRSKPPHKRKRRSKQRGASTATRTMQPHASVRRRKVVAALGHRDEDVEMGEEAQHAAGGGETASAKPMNQDDFRAMLRG